MCTKIYSTTIHIAAITLLVILLILAGAATAAADDGTDTSDAPEKLEQPEYTGETEYNLVYGCKPFKIEIPNMTSVNFTSTNTKVLTVSAGYGENFCTVKIKSSGTAEIIASVSESQVYQGKEYRINVNVDKASQTIIPTKYKISGYYCYGRGWSLEPLAETDCTFKSSNSKIVKIRKGSRIALVNPGKATITITAEETDQYKKAEIKVPVYSYLMKPEIKLRRYSNGRIQISWKPVPGAHKYQIYVYDPVKKKYVCRITKSSKVKSVTHSRLKPGRTYKYKVRAYRIVNGKRVYSSFSKVKKAVARR